VEYVSYPLIKPNSIERRLYQETIFSSAVKGNTLVVLPTGIGKTVIAVLTAAHTLNKEGGKFLVMAPTKPLVEQHKESFSNFLDIAKDDLKVLTGKSNPEKREKEYERSMGIFATPQVIQNDIIAGRIDLKKISFLVVDECHRAVKEYPYPFIAEMYMKKSSGRILALTASPGGTREKINEICSNLFIKNVEIRTENDHDVKPYIQKISVEWKTVTLPENFKGMHKILTDIYRDKLKTLKELRVIPSVSIRRRELLELQGKLAGRINDGDPEVFQAISIVAEALKIEHGIMLLETQGCKALLEYMKRLRTQAENGKSKAVKRIMNDPRFTAVFTKIDLLVRDGIKHPKMMALRELLEKQSAIKPDFKAIIFSHYRDSVNEIVEMLKPHHKPVAFVGQKEGITQKEQVRIIKDFGSGKYDCLVCTSVGEEGLDIPSVDLVIFYEPVPSEIRSIQRRGRTGRKAPGNVVILMTSGTRDEAYYWKSKNSEKRMRQTLKEYSHSSQLKLRTF